MGSIISIFDNCRRGKDDSSTENRPAEPDEAPTEPVDNQEESIKETKQESQKVEGRKESLKDKFKKRLFSSQSKEKEGKERVVIEYKDEDKEGEEENEAIEKVKGEDPEKEKEKEQPSILRKKQTPAPPHDAIRLPHGKLVDPRLAALQGNDRHKPKSTAFENIGQQNAKIQQGEAHKRPMTSGDLVDDEEEVFTDEEEPVPGGIAMPGLQELRKRFSAQGTEVKVRRLSSKERHQDDEGVGEFSSVPRNSALLRRFDRAPPPRRSNARISRMQLRQRAAQEQDLFNSGAWNNNNSSHRNSNRSNEDNDTSDQLGGSTRSSKSSDENVPTTICETKITVNYEEPRISNNKPVNPRHELLRKTSDSDKQRPRSFTPGGIRLLPNNAELLKKLPKKTEEKKIEPNTLSPDSSQNVPTQNRKSVPVFPNNDTYMQKTSSIGLETDTSGYAQVRSDMDLTSVTTSTTVNTSTEIKETSTESADTADKPYHETAL